MKTLWILAAAATFAACANRSDEEVGAAPDRGDDTTAVTTEVDTATGQWDTTSTTGDINADTLTATPSDTALTPTTPADTTVGQYPTPSDTGMDTTTTTPDTGAYAPDPSAAGVDTTSFDTTGGAAGIDTSGYESGMGTDTTGAIDPSADPSLDPSTGVEPGADTAGMDSGMGTDTTTSTSEPSVPADPGATEPTAEPTPQ